MGCACAASSNKVSKRSERIRTVTITSECSYTPELMVIWKEKLICIKTNKLFDEIGFNKYKINFAIGTVDSAIKSGTACIFQKQLDKINDIILSLIATGKC